MLGLAKKQRKNKQKDRAAFPLRRQRFHTPISQATAAHHFVALSTPLSDGPHHRSAADSARRSRTAAATAAALPLPPRCSRLPSQRCCRSMRSTRETATR